MLGDGLRRPLTLTPILAHTLTRTHNPTPRLGLGLRLGLGVGLGLGLGLGFGLGLLGVCQLRLQLCHSLRLLTALLLQHHPDSHHLLRVLVFGGQPPPVLALHLQQSGVRLHRPHVAAGQAGVQRAELRLLLRHLR